MHTQTRTLVEPHDLRAMPFTLQHVGAWSRMYADPEASRQMYSPPADLADLAAYLQEHHATSVFLTETLVGGFTLTREMQYRATFGILVAREYRGLGIGRQILSLLEQRARADGIRTLRADVYSDNEPCLHLLRKHGFREFVWLEKNLA